MLMNVRTGVYRYFFVIRGEKFHIGQDNSTNFRKFRKIKTVMDDNATS